jgi:hypothetical protein
VAKSKKRAIEVAELQRSKKRRRISLPQSRNVTISSDSRNGSDNIEIQLSGTAVAVANLHNVSYTHAKCVVEANFASAVFWAQYESSITFE